MSGSVIISNYNGIKLDQGLWKFNNSLKSDENFTEKTQIFYWKPERRSRIWQFFWWPSEMRVFEVRDPKIHDIIL